MDSGTIGVGGDQSEAGGESAIPFCADADRVGQRGEEAHADHGEGTPLPGFQLGRRVAFTSTGSEVSASPLTTNTS